jgi:GNAT superfamily N-acetyltransferase
MTVSVMPVVASDEQEWLGLFQDYIAFYKASVPKDVIALTWRRLLGREDNMMALIARDAEGRAAGIAALIFHRYLEDLFIAAEVRGQGVGRALIEATYAEADRRGANRTYWATQDDNAIARKLYDRVGQLTEFVQYRR